MPTFAVAQDRPPASVKPATNRSAAKPPGQATTASIAPRVSTAPGPLAATSQSFGGFIQSLWPDAQARGVSRETFDDAVAGLTPDKSVLALTRKQSEFVKPIWSYLTSSFNRARVERGKAAAEQWSDTLARVERQYGVPKEIVLGIWGMETNYGSFFGNTPVIRALATLAHARYRGTFFRDELLTALVILEEGHTTSDRMRGSWAGAMGHTQFMPSSFAKYAVDANGDGKKDIWGSIPDALASTANYLKQFGWNPDLPWGVEITLPERVDYRLMTRSFTDWSQAGVTRANGSALPRRGEATLFLPAGANGPAFLISENFAVIKKYNMSDAYALGVAHLGDRIMDRGSIAGEWPTKTPQLSKPQREAVQRKLKALGFYNDEIDGRLGSGTRDSVRRFQLSRSIEPADGYPDATLLKALTAAR